MNEQIKTDFLRKRMIQLREKNGYTLSGLEKLTDDMGPGSKVHRSILSRAEKVGGSTSFKTVDYYARKYCEWFKLSEKQTELFLRGEKAVIVDVSALIKRHTILDELCEEYSCVFVPSFVIDELGDIENNNPNDYGRLASQLLGKISQDDRIFKKDYSIPTKTDLMIVDLANAVADDMNCYVDIITYDYKIAAQIKACMNKYIENVDEPEPKFRLLYLEEYVAVKQKLVNTDLLNAINTYYADSYEDMTVKLDISLSPQEDESFLDALLLDGTTLIISAVNNLNIPVDQRKQKIRWLIDHGADINKRDCGDKYLPPISHAIRNHDLEMFSFIYEECKADPNVGSRYPYDVGKIRCKNDGNMPLMIAAWENQVDIVRILCSDSRVSLNQQDGNGYTALIKACYWGYKECRKIIEEAGADTTILDHEGLSAMDRWKECLELGRYKERDNDDRQSMYFYK